MKKGGTGRQEARAPQKANCCVADTRGGGPSGKNPRFPQKETEGKPWEGPQ